MKEYREMERLQAKNDAVFTVRKNDSIMQQLLTADPFFFPGGTRQR